MEAFGRVAEIMVTVVLIFLCPLYYMAQKQDMLCQTYLTGSTTYFVDSIRNTGKVTRDMYETFLNELYFTGMHFDILLTCYEPYVLWDGEEPVKKYRIVGQTELIEQLYQEEACFFQAGDYIQIHIRNRTPSLGMKLRNTFLGTDYYGETSVRYGGTIRNETG